MINIVVAGSRHINNNELVYNILDYYIGYYSKYDTVTIITGGASGIDSIAHKYAIENNINNQVFKADWNKYGKKAGPIRNEEMAKAGNILIAIWDRVSPGTRNMIKLARGYNLLTYIFDQYGNLIRDI